MLLIEHNIGLVLNSATISTCSIPGEIIEAGPPAAIQASERVRHAYMGTAGRRQRRTRAMSLLEVEDLVVRYGALTALRGVSLQLDGGRDASSSPARTAPASRRC